MRPAFLATLVLFSCAAPQQNSEEIIQRTRAHYQQVDAELQAKDVSHLTEDQRQGRAALLSWFRQYHEEGNFGVNDLEPGSRLPLFIDDQGTRCAVANLLDKTGEEELTHHVAQSNNFAWVAELAGDARFQSWLAQHGLTLEEAARIQAPMGGGGGTPPARTFPAPPSLPTPGATRGSSPMTPDRTGASAPTAPATSAPKSGATAPVVPATGQRSSGMSLETGVNPSWITWWEMNKLGFLDPQRQLHFGPVTGNTDAGPKDRLRLEQERFVQLVHPLLKSNHASTRAAATITLGRIGGAEVFSSLQAMLKDPHALVRNSAVLALGASGSQEALPLLLDLAQEDQAKAVSRPLAIVALGLSRQAGSSPQSDHAVATLFRKLDKNDRNDLGTAIMLYNILAPASSVTSLARSMQGTWKKNQDSSLACRTVEFLAKQSDPQSLVELMNALSGKQREIRRSAALALGLHDSELALPPLQTAFELETEPLTRGFTLIAIGQQGGPEAEEFLMKIVAKGNSSQRPWAALGLGILWRQSGEAISSKSRKAIAKALEREGNQENRPAYLIALGLARDAASLPLMQKTYAGAKNPVLRMYTSFAMAMTGAPEARDILREALEKEKRETLRAALAQALGLYGNPQDSDSLLQVIGNLSDPTLQSFAAVALHFHKQGSDLAGLEAILQNPRSSTVSRDTALNAIGLLLGKRPGLSFARISSHANYMVFPGWLNGMLQFTL